MIASSLAALALLDAFLPADVEGPGVIWGERRSLRFLPVVR